MLNKWAAKTTSVVSFCFGVVAGLAKRFFSYQISCSPLQHRLGSEPGMRRTSSVLLVAPSHLSKAASVALPSYPCTCELHPTLLELVLSDRVQLCQANGYEMVCWWDFNLHFSFSAGKLSLLSWLYLNGLILLDISPGDSREEQISLKLNSGSQ